MNAEQMWREVYESVEGNCWHKFQIPSDYSYHSACEKCSLVIKNRYQYEQDKNPPLTLDALFEVAKAFDISNIHFQGDRVEIKDGHTTHTGHYDNSDKPECVGLLNALHQAILKAKHKPMFPGPSMEGPLNDV